MMSSLNLDNDFSVCIEYLDVNVGINTIGTHRTCENRLEVNVMSVNILIKLLRTLVHSCIIIF